MDGAFGETPDGRSISEYTLTIGRKMEVLEFDMHGVDTWARVKSFADMKKDIIKAFNSLWYDYIINPFVQYQFNKYRGCGK